MYEIFEKLCNEKDITPYRVGKDTGIATSTLSDWKKGESTPKLDKMKKIADYFGVSVDYLMNGEEPEFTTENAMLDAKISKDAELKSAIRKYYTLSDKQRKHVLDTINMLAEDK